MTSIITSVVAQSISRPANARLRGGNPTARVLAVFERACDLVTPDGDVLALVLPEIGEGPFNIVVDGERGLFADLSPGLPVTTDASQIALGDLGIDLKNAVVWEPCPDWAQLQSHRDTIAARLPLLQTLYARHAPAGALFLASGAADRLTAATRSAVERAVQALEAGWRGAGDRLHSAGEALAGLGSGLTPAGDDFLTGVMLAARLAHPAPVAFCEALARAAVPRTTTLSAAFLQAAARGECSAAWHKLFAALVNGPDRAITAAVKDVLAHGATSGADSLAGFTAALSWIYDPHKLSLG